MLHQIISNFLARIKSESLKYEDIIRTDSGATRCQTNLRFAMQSLRDAGLIKENKVEVVQTIHSCIDNSAIVLRSWRASMATLALKAALNVLRFVIFALVKLMFSTLTSGLNNGVYNIIMTKVLK